MIWFLDLYGNLTWCFCVFRFCFLLGLRLAERMGVEEAHMLGLQEIRSFRVN